MISIIVAMDKNNLIGKDNKLPWKLKNDMTFFKNMTYGENIIMGRKTFDSVGVLPGRTSIVLTKDKASIKPHSNVHPFDNINYFIEDQDNYIVIGGSEIYRLFLPYADVMHITVINETFVGDAYFPHWNEDEWLLKSTEHHFKSEGHEYDHTFHKYIRKN